MTFDQIKVYNGQQYSGMPVGRSHMWDYHDASWKETKMTPDLWSFQFNANKSRLVPAPVNSGAELHSAYHWLIVADQRAIKTSANDYQTVMQGLKFKVGHKRLHWKKYSYDYNGQVPYKQKVIDSLMKVIEQLQQEVSAEVEQNQVNLLLDSFNR